MADFLRQLDIVSPRELLYPLTILGVGGIGSAAAITFSKMGFGKITLYDPGRVEGHNRPNQWFRSADEVDESGEEGAGRLKVEAMKEIVGHFAEWCQVEAVPEPFWGQKPLEGIVLCAIDHMQADENGLWGRREIWDSVRFSVNVPLYIDCRLGGELVQVYTVRPCALEDVEDYEETLFSEGEAMELPCTAQQIIYTGLEAAVLAASQFKKWLKEEPYSSAVTFSFKASRLLLA